MAGQAEQVLHIIQTATRSEHATTTPDDDLSRNLDILRIVVNPTFELSDALEELVRLEDLD